MAVSPSYIISSDLAAIGLIHPVPVVGAIDQHLALERAGAFEFADQRRHPGIVGVGGLQTHVDADRLLGGPAVDPGQLGRVWSGGYEVAALESQRVPRSERLWAA